ncbi:hypothetical protein N9M10_03630 [Hellea sp.]|nr:hypothetical protein [Hellea sp.]
MQSGQTRAILARKVRAGMANNEILREKRLGDLAWQMTVATQKLSACPKEKQMAKERLERLYGDAKAEYERIKFEREIENAAQDYGVYLG